MAGAKGRKILRHLTRPQASFVIDDGIAKTTDVQVAGPAFAVTGSGES